MRYPLRVSQTFGRRKPGRILTAALIAACTGSLLSACGGSSGGGTPAATTTVSGSVFAAPVSGASVTVKNATGDNVAGPVTTAADGTYSVAVPSSALSEELRFESSGGTFTDEATGTTGVTAGRLAAYVEAKSLCGGSAIHLTPASTILCNMVTAGMSLSNAKNAFSTAFGFTDNVFVAPINDNSVTGSDNVAKRLAALRAMTFSQMAEDMGIPPASQFELVSKLAEDLSDGVLNGRQGATALSVGGVPLREDIQNRFNNALANCFADTTCNKTGLLADQIGMPPFAKVAHTNSYRVEYVPDTMMPAAMQGKTQFQIKVNRLSDNAAVTGLLTSGEFRLYPYMHMSSKSHSSPVDNTMFTEGPAGTYNCTAYYLMSTMMSGMSMGFWELNVTVNGETATLFPFVGMPMGTDTVRAILRGVNDIVASASEPKRRYFFFKDGPVTGGDTIHLFLAAYDTMTSWPAVYAGMTPPLHDNTGAAWPVTDVLVEASADNTTARPWISGTSDPLYPAHWTVTVPGLTGPADNVYLRLRVNGEWKTTLGKSTDPDYIPFQVTP